MRYDVENAPFAIGTLLFIFPHLLVGAALLIGAIKGECVLRGAPRKLALVFQGLVGLAFFGVAVSSIINNSIDTYRCRNAIGSGQAEKITGPLVIEKRFFKPGYGYIDFKVGDRSFRTQTEGLDCDCGYVQPLGRTTSIKESQNVEVEVYNGSVLRLSDLP